MSSPYIAACESILSSPYVDLQSQPVADLEQLRELWLIDKEAYQDQSLEFEEFSQWWQCYPLGSRVLLADGRIVASIGVYPLSAKQAIGFASGDLPESELQPVFLDDCQQQPVRDWYASGIVVVESMRGKNNLLKKLLQIGLSSWLESGHVTYPLNVMAIAEYDIGRRLLEFFGFSKTQDGAQMADGFDLYQTRFESKRQAIQSLRLRTR